MAILRIEKGPGAGNTFFLKEKEFIGRDAAQASIHIPDNKISSCHALILKRNESYYLEAQNSKNHTFINGRPVESKVRLESGDYINVGSTWMCFEEEEEVERIAKELETYEVIQQLKKIGGIGHHYKVRQTKLDRVVALQLLPPNIIKAHPDLKKKFRLQAKSLAKLNHENVAIILDFEAKESHLYYTTEYVEGDTIASMVEKDQPLELEQALEIGMGVAYGLAHAHSQGVIHQDINPNNIVLSGQRVILTGFGLGAIFSDIQERFSSLVGNIEYFSPEKLSGREVDYRSDIYSFGILLYKLLTGHAPFVGETIDEIIESQLHDIPALTNFNTNIPAEVEKLVYQCLERSKEARPQDVAAVANTLENILYKHRAISLAQYEDIYTSLWKYAITKTFYHPLFTILVGPLIAGLLLLLIHLSK